MKVYSKFVNLHLLIMSYFSTLKLIIGLIIFDIPFDECFQFKKNNFLS